LALFHEVLRAITDFSSRVNRDADAIKVAHLGVEQRYDIIEYQSFDGEANKVFCLG
jgi:hypothetical protein